MSDEKVVVLKVAGWSPIQGVGRGGSFPTADYGMHCACCDADTNMRLKYNPSTGYAATPIAIPVCTDCLPHIQKSNPVAAFLIGLGSLLLFAMGPNNGAVFYVLGVVAVAVAVAIWQLGERRKSQMREKGHHVGLAIVAIPGLVQVRSTNARFADEVRSRNPDLAKPAA